MSSTNETAPNVVILNSIAKTSLKLGKEEGGKLLYAITDYFINGTIPQLSGTPSLIWEAVFPNIENTRKISLGRSKGGKKGGKASKCNNPNGRRGKGDASGSPDSETPATAKKRLKIPPTLQEVEEYITENNLNVNATDFFLFHEQRNWEVEGRPIKDLAALLRKWSDNEAEAAQWQSQQYKASTEERYFTNEGRETEICGVTYKLGYGEFIDAAGYRTYGNGRTRVPQCAPPRPANCYEWSDSQNKWL